MSEDYIKERLREAFMEGVKSVEVWFAGTSHQNWLDARRRTKEAEEDFEKYLLKARITVNQLGGVDEENLFGSSRARMW